MADETNQPAANETGLRDVPSDIGEYEKFVAEGGNEHNEKVLNRDKAIADAKAAGILPENPEEQNEEKKHRNSFQQRVTRLQRKIGERDQRIRDLEAQAAADKPAAAAPNGKRETQQAATPATAAPAGTEKPHVNGEAKTPPRPKEDDFKTYGEFIEALTDWKTDRKLEAAEEKSSRRRPNGPRPTRGRRSPRRITRASTKRKRGTPTGARRFRGSMITHSPSLWSFSSSSRITGRT